MKKTQKKCKEQDNAMKIFNSTKSWPEKVYKPYSSSEKHSSQINTTILHMM